MAVAREQFVIPGDNCGTKNAWKTFNKLPTENIANLTCVMTTDQVGFAAWKASQPQWTFTGDWTACSVTCGHGVQHRTRECFVNGVSVDASRCHKIASASTDLNVTQMCRGHYWQCPCAEYDLNLDSADISVVEDVEADQCHAACLENENCAYYVLQSYQRRCHLKAERGESVSLKAYVTAPRNCSINGPKSK